MMTTRQAHADLAHLIKRVIWTALDREDLPMLQAGLSARAAFIDGHALIALRIIKPFVKGAAR